jgi:hypothetical protein
LGLSLEVQINQNRCRNIEIRRFPYVLEVFGVEAEKV